MPIWFELLILALVTYGGALCAGWLILGREAEPGEAGAADAAQPTNTDTGS